MTESITPPASSRRPFWRPAFLLLLVALLALHIPWFATDSRPPFWDQYRYFEMSASAERVFDGTTPARDLLSLHASHPPAYPILGALWVRLGGATLSGESVRTFNLFCLLLTACAAGLLARRLLPGNRWLAGTGAALLSPLLTSFVHFYYLENLLVPCVLFSLWALMASDRLQKRGYVVALGILMGLGCLVKWTFPVFLIGPCLIVLWSSRRWLRAAAIVGIACLIAGPWYALHFRDILDFFGEGVTGGEGWLSARDGLGGLIYYPKALVYSGLGLLAAPLAALGALRLWNHPQRLLLASFLIIPLVAFGLILTKKPRHLLPLLPLLGILAIYGATWFRGLQLQRVLIASVLLHLTLASVAASYLPAERNPKLRIMGLELPLLSLNDAPGPPDSTEWPYEALLRAAEKATQNVGARPVRGLCLFNLVRFREDGLRYFTNQLDLPLDVRLIALEFPRDKVPDSYFPLSTTERQLGLEDAQFLLTKSGTQWVRYQGKITGRGGPLPVHRFGARLLDGLDNLSPKTALGGAAFRAVHREALPDGSEAKVWVASPDSAARRRLLARFILAVDPEHDAAYASMGWPVLEVGAARMARLAQEGILHPAEAEARTGNPQAHALQAALDSDPWNEGLWRAAADLPTDDALGQEARSLLDLWYAARVRKNPADSWLRLAAMQHAAGRPRGCRQALLRALQADKAASVLTQPFAAAYGLVDSGNPTQWKAHLEEALLTMPR